MGLLFILMFKINIIIIWSTTVTLCVVDRVGILLIGSIFYNAFLSKSFKKINHSPANIDPLVYRLVNGKPIIVAKV